MTRIIADSTCDLNPKLLKDYDLTILPLGITIENETYADGIDIQVNEIYGYMRRGILPKTSQITYDDVSHTFRKFAEAGEDFIYISFSSKMSGCYEFATMIQKELAPEYPNVKMTVIDSKGGSSATGLIVWQALIQAASGMEYGQIVRDIQFMSEHIEHIFSVADLEWLALGGRISKPLGYLGNKLNLKPWLDVQDGAMHVRGMVHGRKKAIHLVAEELVKRAAPFPEQMIAINHADDLESALELEECVKSMLPECQTTISHIGGILGVHIGICAIGGYCLNQKPEHYSLPDHLK